MSEEITTEVTEVSTVGTEQATIENERNTPAFRAITEQLNKERAARKALEDAQAAKLKEAEEAKLRADGNFKELEKRLTEEFTAKEAAARLEVRTAKIEALLASVQNKRVQKGLFHEMMELPDGTDLSAHVSELRKTEPELFETDPFPMSQSTPQGVRSSGGGGQDVDWKKVRADHRSNNRAAVDKAIALLDNYKATHGGQYPPGW